MVTELGMSDKLGPVRYVGPAGLGYLGSQATALSLSPETERMIDEEIRRILVDAEKEAMAIVADNESALHEIARVLQDQEVIDGEAVGQIVAEQRRNG
jgi:cell division protease FtsH